MHTRTGLDEAGWGAGGRATAGSVAGLAGSRSSLCSPNRPSLSPRGACMGEPGDHSEGRARRDTGMRHSDADSEGMHMALRDRHIDAAQQA